MIKEKEKAKQIGKFKPKNRFFLAPMVEANDIAFRMLCKKAGAGLTYTGMINPLTQKELELDDKPALQIFTNTTKGICEFIKKYEKKVTLFDFNLGCPAKTAKELGFGVFMQDNLVLIESILKEMRSCTKKPITVKLRKSPHTIDIIKIANKYCDAIAIHPRTQKQGYSGEPDLEFAIQLKKYTDLPIIYSGDVNEKNYEKFLEHFDFLMIGRRAIGDPGIFSILNGKKDEKIWFLEYMKLAQEGNIPWRKIKFHALTMVKGMDGAKNLRREIMNAKTTEEIEEIYSRLMEERK